MEGVSVSVCLRIRQLSCEALLVDVIPALTLVARRLSAYACVDAGAHHSVGHPRTLVNNSTSARTVAEGAELVRHTMICKELLPLMLVGVSGWL